MKQQASEATAAIERIRELIVKANRQSASIAAKVESLRLMIAENKSQREREAARQS